MNINKFDVLALSNNKKIVVLDKINFMDNDFLFANEVLYDETMATNKYKILLVDYKNKVLKKVTNPEALSILLPKFVERIN
mgnify:FL=1